MVAGWRGTAVFAEGNSAEECQTQGAQQAAEWLKAGHGTIGLKHTQKSAVQEMAIRKHLIAYKMLLANKFYTAMTSAECMAM